MQISTLASFDAFLTIITLAILAIVMTALIATVIDEFLWWALPTKAKVAIKTLEWRIECLGAQYAVWKYNNYNRLFNRHSNWLTRAIRANAQADMRIAIGHAESRLETLSLLLNGIQE
jgi:hypothetical protein